MRAFRDCLNARQWEPFGSLGCLSVQPFPALRADSTVKRFGSGQFPATATAPTFVANLRASNRLLIAPDLTEGPLSNFPLFRFGANLRSLGWNDNTRHGVKFAHVGERPFIVRASHGRDEEGRPFIRLPDFERHVATSLAGLHSERCVSTEKELLGQVHGVNLP